MSQCIKYKQEIESLLSLLGPVKYSLTLVLLVFAGFFLYCLGKFLGWLIDDFYPVAVAMALFSILFIIAIFFVSGEIYNKYFKRED